MTIHQEANVLIFNIKMSQKGSFEKRNPSLTILLSSSSLPQNMFHDVLFYYNNISMSRVVVFFPLEHLFASPIAKPVGPCHWIMHSFKYVFWRPRNPQPLKHLFPSENRSGPRMSSTTNHIFYMPLGRLHSRWCKQAPY